MISSIKTLSFLGLVLSAALVQVASAQTPVGLDTVRVASGLARPLYVTAPVGDTSRLFIVEQRSGSVGAVRVMTLPGNVLNPTPYLSVSPVATGNEEGLLGLAFHPNFATNGFFYVYNTNSSGNNQVTRYTANAPFTTSTTANAGSALAIIPFAHPTNSNHNGGWIAFGPDGYLYIGTGDGGGGDDVPNNAQNKLSYLGKMHRIDVNGDDFPTDATRNYAIPPTNPFVGDPNALPEIWFYGLRNPWRNSFDRLTGDLWIGDVGQNAVEEIDFAPAGIGGTNFGWRCTEGTSCTGNGGCTCGDPNLKTPVYTYTHSTGICVTGGYRYRGSELCGWDGTYFFADYSASNIYSFGWNGTSLTNFATRTSELAPGGGFSINAITSFGEDANGELYIVKQGTGTNGEVYKVIRTTTLVDCNSNGIQDACDIINATSLDNNMDGIPDECQPSVTASCFGDGTSTHCPCASGAAGRGCPNSTDANGALLSSVGNPIVHVDTFHLNGSNMPSVAPVVYFQGSVAATPVTVFGDGLLCAGGTVIRLATKFNSGGASSFPDFFDTATVSQQGGILAGPATRTYQGWYRDQAPTFCTGAGFNLTNALTVGWIQ